MIPEIKEHPILFSEPMIQAILEGRKTQTRRIVKPQPEYGIESCGWSVTQWAQRNHDFGCSCVPIKCPFGHPEEHLWVRETWANIDNSEIGEKSYFEYRADSGNKYPGGWPEELAEDPRCGRWRPSIHMPRAASRIILEIEDIRAERLQDISPQDARSEGIGNILEFIILWEKIHGIGSWNQNPWVWVIQFKNIEIKKHSVDE